MKNNHEAYRQSLFDRYDQLHREISRGEQRLDLLREHLEDRTLMYSNYLPGEAYKLENAYLASHGKYVILCVAADFEAAEEIINAAVK